MQTIDNLGFRHLWRGVVRAGDVLLFDYSGCSGMRLTARVIRSVQRRLLRDLGAAEDARLEEHRFSHAAIASGCGAILEMTTPAARVNLAGLVPDGVRVMVRRPRHEGEDIPEEIAAAIVDAAWRDVSAGRRYPTGELLTYWLWSWGVNKLMLGKKFVEVFTSDRADVCSGSVWRWCIEAGLFRDSEPSDLRPEAWYPARLAADNGNRFRTVGVWKLTEATADAGPDMLRMEPSGVC